MSDAVKRKRRVSSRDVAIALFGLLGVGGGLLAAGELGHYYVSTSEQVIQLNPVPNPYSQSKKLDPHLFNLNSFYYGQPPVVRVDMEPEFISSLNASTPKEKVCRKIRYKKAPVNAISIDGTEIDGENWIRYRGYCYPHWFGEQKSVKIQLADNYRGYNTLNLNAIDTDRQLYEIWANQLMSISGGVASRVDYAKLYINGKYEGLRFLVENIDWDLLKNQGLKRGGVYREITSAYLGHRPTVERGAYRPYQSVIQMQETWDKNADKSFPWEPFADFNAKVYDSVVTGSEAWRSAINIEHYINYVALQVITGTHHQNNHNIPVYQPRVVDSNGQDTGQTEGVIPIGYDFGVMYSSGINDQLNTRNMHLYAMSQNWVTSLLWTDPELRQRINDRVIEIVLDHDPVALYDRIAARSEELFRGEKNAEQIVGSFAPMRETIARRMTFLRDSFLRPTASISPDWATAPRFQLMIDGIGRYEISLDVAERACDRSFNPVRARFGEAGEAVVAECVEGKVVAVPAIVERDDFQRDAIKHYWSYIWRQGLGGLLVSVDNSAGLEFRDIKVRSLNVPPRLRRRAVDDVSVPVAEDWPLFIERTGDGVASLGDPAAIERYRAQGGRIDVLNLNEPGKLDFESTEDGSIRITTYDIEPRTYFHEFGPLVCWKSQNSGSCLELTERFLYPDAWKVKRTGPSEETPQAPEQGIQVVTAQMAEQCEGGTFKFHPGLWRIGEGVLFGQDCTLQFAPFANLEFGESGYLVALGPVTFPETGRVDFTGIEGRNWLGTVFKGQKTLDIRNATFSRGTEFLWNGTYYTGTVNVIDVGRTTVTGSRFFDNDSDDGLNIRGGEALVEGNYFARNRDGLDLDLCVATVRNNVFLDHMDDGIDLGTAGPIHIVDNVLFNSGDKGISIGEGSKTVIEGNLLSRNNFGIANKDGSDATLAGNYFYGNAIGISAYNKTSTDASVTGVKGSSFFLSNASNYKIEKGAPALESVAALFASSETDRTQMEKAANGLLTACSVCASSTSLEKVLP